MRKKLQVFISSTFTDLRDERQAAVAAILKNGHIPAGMELFAAGNEEQMRVIERWIDESDIYLLLLGKRYGSIEPKSGKSYTHVEYEYASLRDKPLFAIVLTDIVANAKVHKGMKVEEVYEQAHQDRWRAFEALVKSKMCSFADDEKDIRLAIGESLRDLEARHNFAGWISGRDVPDNSRVLGDIAAAGRRNAELETQNQGLTREVAQLRKDAAKRRDYNGRTFEELMAALTNHEVSLEFEDQPPEKTTLLDALYRFAGPLAGGISNAATQGNFGSVLFYRVASPLAAYGIATHDRVPADVHWKRLVLSETGQRFVTELRVRLSQSVPAEGSSSSDAPAARERARDGAQTQSATDVASPNRSRSGGRKKSKRDRSGDPDGPSS